KQQKQSKAADQLARTLEAQAKTQGLDKAAAAHNLQVQTSEYFSNADSLPGIGKAPDFMQAAFSAKPKSPPQLARIPSGYALLEVIDQQPGKSQTLDEARQREHNKFCSELAHAELKHKAQELPDRAKALHDLK